VPARTFSVDLISSAPGRADTSSNDRSIKVDALEGRAMYRYPTEQLMTVEEAEHLSRLEQPGMGRDRREERARIWAWQTVSGAMSQTVSEEQVDQMMKLLRRK
jgi:hypothetical protein